MDKYGLLIGYEDMFGIEDYWYITLNTYPGGIVLGTNTPNESMARRWLSMKHLNISKEDIDEMVYNAKKARGWIND